MCEAVVRVDDAASVRYTTSDGISREILVPIVAPPMIQRVTGTLRSPERTVDLHAPAIAEMVSLKTMVEHGPVIGLLMHTGNGRTVAVGKFPSPDAANTWWSQPYNRFEGNRDVVFMLIPVR